MAKKIYALMAVAFCLATIRLWAQAGAGIEMETALTNLTGGLDFTNLSKLKSGLAVSWVEYTYNVQSIGDKREQRFYWVGTFDAFTFTNSSIITSKDGKVLDSDMEVWGRKNGVRWQATSYEKGIVDINSKPTKQQIQVDNAMLYPLTNVLTMGIGLHWDVNSIQFLTHGKVIGKSNHTSDNFDGQITYLPNGQVQSLFYDYPSLHMSFLLKFSYRTEQDQFPNGFELWQAFALPGGKVYPAGLIVKDDVLSISELTPDMAKSAGIPDPALYQNALITNGVTKPSSPYALTPEVIGAGTNSVDATQNSERLKVVKIRTAIFTLLLLPLVVLAFVAFKRRNLRL